MKRWFIAGCAGWAVAWAGVGGGAEPLPAIAKLAEEIRVDGVLDEPAWKKAAVVRADYEYGKAGQPSATPRMAVRYAWDGDYLYLAYETFDANLIALASPIKEGPPGNLRQGCEIHHPQQKVDVVEFFIASGERRLFWELHHNAANQFNDIWCTVLDDDSPGTKLTQTRFGIHFGAREIVEDDAAAGKTLAMASRLKPKANGGPSTVNDASDVDTGYTAELRIPWVGLNPPVAAENYVPIPSDPPGAAPRRIHGPWKLAQTPIKILAVVQDGDLQARYHHSSPTLAGGWFHKNFDHYPTYVLAE